MATKKNTMWVNNYTRHNTINTSTPYASFEECEKHILDMIGVLGTIGIVYNRVSPTEWVNDRGAKIKIEEKGDLRQHIKDTWIACSCNYVGSGDIAADDYEALEKASEEVIDCDEMIDYLMGKFGDNDEGMDEFAEKFYTDNAYKRKVLGEIISLSMYNRLFPQKKIGIKS